MTAQPTREYRQHHDVEAPAVDATAFRQGWRIRTRLDQLLADGRISRDQWQAASEYRDAWGRALRLGSLGTVRLAQTRGASDPHGRALATLDSIERLRVVDAALGPFAAGLCFACVVEDMSWAAVGRYCHRDPTTVRNWTIAALHALCRAWGGSGAGSI